MGSMGEGRRDPPEAAPVPSRKRRSGTRMLMLLVALCALGVWAWRNAMEGLDPVAADYRAAHRRALAALESAGPSGQVAAIQDLERLTTEDYARSLTPLIELLESPDSGVRAASAKGVGSLGEGAIREGDEEVARGAVTALLARLRDPEPPVRAASASALALLTNMGVPASPDAAAVRAAIIDALEELIVDPEPEVRRAAIGALAQAGGPAGPPEALAVGLEDEVAENRAAVLVALAGQRRLDPWVARALRVAEHDPDPAVREQAVGSLQTHFRPAAITGACVPDLAAGLKSASPRVRGLSAMLLGSLDPAAESCIPDLLRVLNEPMAEGVTRVRGLDGSFDPACEAAWTLGRIAPRSPSEAEVIASLVDVVDSGPIERRGWAAMALGEFGAAAESTVPSLIRLSEGVEPGDPIHLAGSAAAALGKIAPGSGSEEAAISALRVMLRPEVGPSRMQVIEALTRFGPGVGAAKAELQGLLDDGDSNVRQYAKSALERVDAPATQ